MAWQYFEPSLEGLIELTLQEKIELGDIHIPIKADVSKKKNNNARVKHSYKVWHLVSWEFLRI